MILGNLSISLFGGVLSRQLSHSELKMNNSESLSYLKKYLSMDYSDFENPEIRQLRRRIIESSRINGHGRQLLLKSLNRIVDNIIGTCIALILSIELITKSFSGSPWYITFFFVCSISVLMILNIKYNFYIKNNGASVAGLISRTMTDNNRVDHAIDCYNMGKDVRIYNQAPIILNIKKKRLLSHKEAFRSYSMYQFKTGIPLLILMSCMNIFIYGFVVFNAAIGTFEIGSVIKYVILPQKLIECTLGLFKGVADIKSNTKFVEDYLFYLTRPAIMQKENKVLPYDVINNGRFKIEFIDVSFRYPGSDSYVLRHVSFQLFSTDRIAIVGMNGSGKTTCIKLLCRLYDPTEGCILINGVDIRDYNYDQYLSLFSVVFQDFKLFSFSLGQNVSGSSKFDRGAVIKCLDEVGFQPRLSKLTDDIDTFLYKDFDENGLEISGGEAQKIALARAIYRKAPCVILDEPTSALDPISEFEIYTKFNEIIQNKTAVFISHRLASCRFCNRVIVFRNGEIVQIGPHNDLVRDTHGHYYELWNAQATYYE